MKNNGWTPERRAKQAKMIKQWQPWKTSTGAKTEEGKARSSQNAFKGAERKKMREMTKLLNRLLREQKDNITRE